MANPRINVILGAKDEASKVVKGLRGQFERFKKDAMTGFGLGAGISVFNMGAKALRGVVDVAGDAISASSDLSESQSKVDQVFTDSARTIHDWAADSAHDFGLSSAAALEAAGTFGNFIQALGNAEGEANDMSRTLVELAADLASFNNQDISEVLIALRSGLAGEAEPMRRLGVSLSAARVESYLLAKGIVKTKKEITDAHKVSARYALIMEDTAKAQGDFDRTSEGLANSQRIMAAEIDDALAVVGQALLPVAEGFTHLAAEVIPSAVEQAAALAGVVGGLADDLDALATGEVRASTEAQLVADSLGIELDALLSMTNQLREVEARTQALTNYNDEMARSTDKFNATMSESEWMYEQVNGALADNADGTRELTDAEKELRAAAEAVIRMNARYARAAGVRADAIRRDEEATGDYNAILSATSKKEMAAARKADYYTRKRIEAAEAEKRHVQEAEVRAEALAALQGGDIWEGPQGAGKRYDDEVKGTRNLNKRIDQLGTSRDKWEKRYEKALRNRKWTAAATAKAELDRTTSQLTQSKKARQALRQERRRILGIGTESETTKQKVITLQDTMAEGATFKASVDDSEVDALILKMIALEGGRYGGSVGGNTKGALLDGGRAAGGPVSAGETYLVGERGPELLHMGSSGSITPNHRLPSGDASTSAGKTYIVGQPGHEEYFTPKGPDTFTPSRFGGGNGGVFVIDGARLIDITDRGLGRRFSLTGGSTHYRSAA